MAADLGCAGLLIPERHGGAGASYREAAAAAEALAGFVAAVPFLGSAVVATAALLSVDSADASSASARAVADLLGRMADGGVTAALALPFAAAPGSAYPTMVRLTGTRPGDAADGVARLSGLVSGVADALPAGVLLVPADGVPHGLYLVDMAAPGVAKRPVTSLDMTRQLCDLAFDDAPGTLIASGPVASRALDAALGAGAGMLAAEQVGLAQRCLDMTLAYVKERRQFARPVGSFQGLKWRLADLWVAVTQARAASRYAAACLATGDPRRQGGGGAGPGLLLGGGGAGRPGMRADARRHRLHLGTSRAPVPETREGGLDRLRHPGRAPRRAGVPGQPAHAMTDKT